MTPCGGLQQSSKQVKKSNFVRFHQRIQSQVFSNFQLCWSHNLVFLSQILFSCPKSVRHQRQTRRRNFPEPNWQECLFVHLYQKQEKKNLGTQQTTPTTTKRTTRKKEVIVTTNSLMTCVIPVKLFVKCYLKILEQIFSIRSFKSGWHHKTQAKVAKNVRYRNQSEWMASIQRSIRSREAMGTLVVALWNSNHSNWRSGLWGLLQFKKKIRFWEVFLTKNILFSFLFFCLFCCCFVLCYFCCCFLVFSFVQEICFLCLCAFFQFFQIFQPFFSILVKICSKFGEVVLCDECKWQFHLNSCWRHFQRRIDLSLLLFCDIQNKQNNLKPQRTASLQQIPLDKTKILEYCLELCFFVCLFAESPPLNFFVVNCLTDNNQIKNAKEGGGRFVLKLRVTTI